MNRFMLLLVLMTFHMYGVFGLTLRHGLPKDGETDVVYKQTQTGEENYFLHIKNVYVALPDLTKLFQSLGEHTTFSFGPSTSFDEDSDCKGPYCNETPDFTFSTKVPTVAEESVDAKPTEATGLVAEVTNTDEPKLETIKNDKDAVEIVESTTYKINTEVHVVQQQKLPNSANTHEIFIPVQVLV